MSRFYFFKETGYRLDLGYGIIRRYSSMGFQIPADCSTVASSSLEEVVPEEPAVAKKTRVDRSEQFAAFLAGDAELNPSKMIPLTEGRLARAKRLVKGVHID